MVVREQPPVKPELKSEAGAENPGDKKEQGELVPVQFDRLSGEVAVWSLGRNPEIMASKWTAKNVG